MILIIDDTPINLSVVVACMQQHGLTVAVAQDGLEGLRRAEFVQPGLILLDVMLPGLDGFAICRRLKENPRTRHIPVIFMTALAQQEDKVRGFAAGGIDYVTKPLQMDEVVARVDTHLKLHALQRQLAAQNAQLQAARSELELRVAHRTAELFESNRQLRAEIGEREQTEKLLREREQEFREMAEHSPDTIARYDRRGRRVYANARLIASMGAAPPGPAAEPWGPQCQEIIGEVFERGEKRDFEWRWQAGGAEFCTQVRMMPEFDRGGQVAHVLAVGRDITEIDRYRKKVHQQAFFDSLTGLPNRLLLSERMADAIADGAARARQFGLLVLDLDNFKQVNDALGHGVGDRLLCQAAQRMRACVRGADTVARLGGDEFAALLPDAGDGAELAARAAEILRALLAPFVIDGRELFVTGSIGIARYPDDSGEAGALYKFADSAMYHAKKMGRNNFQFYAPEFTARSLERMEIEAALRKAWQHGELALHFQPQIALQSGRVVSAEALLRWQRPGHGMVPPDRFIPLAEESGLIVEIGAWVLRRACQAAVDWNRGRAQPVRVAVNLSTRQFIRNDLVGCVREVLATTGCQPAWLELEITESLLLEDSAEVAAMLAALHDMGLSISIDDFGTGYSALSYLNRFPVGQIKIDRSFVQGIPEQRDKCELVKAMLSIAAALRLESVAEGVETLEQAQYLMASGCRLAQGYLFGRPMPLAEFVAVLAAPDRHD